jgi:SAM-dependent methyltransferase
MTRRPCPACAAGRAVLVHRLALCTPDGHPLGTGYDVVSCDDCGTGFADVPDGQAYYDAYYADSAKYAGEAAADRPDAGLVAESPHTAARMAGIADRLRTVIRDRNARILDVGCANGSLLAALRRIGYTDLVGLDPAPASRHIAGAVHDVRVETGTLSALPASLGTFDFVSMIGVLEHVWDTDDAVAAVRAVVRPGGVLWVDVPDASRYLAPYIAPFQDFSSEHVNHFSAASLERLASRHGFRVESTVRYFPELVPGAPSCSIAQAWTLADGPSVAPGAHRDEELREVLLAFAARSTLDFAAMGEYLDAELADSDCFAVWGAGEFTMKLLATPALLPRRLAAVVDGNPGRQGMHFRGIPVTDPAMLPAAIPVVVGSLLSAAPIAAMLRSRGHRAVTCRIEHSPAPVHTA